MPSSAKTMPKRPRRPRGSINPADIVAGAFEFCRDTPVEELTMPQLAAFLNVGVTSIYWYFKSKRELLDAMTDQAVASFCESMPAARGESWDALLRDFFVNGYRMLASDELNCDLIVRRTGGSDDAPIRSWPQAEELIAKLTAAGFPPSLARHAFVTLSIYTQGFLLVQRTGRMWGPIAPPPAPQQRAGGGRAPSGGPAEEFEFGLVSIIRGLAPLLPGEPRAPGPV